MSVDPESTLRGLQSVCIFKLKDDKIAEPNIYLGAQMGRMDIDGRQCWMMSAEKYILASVRNVEEMLEKKGLRLPTKCYTPLPTDYRPELDTSSELKSDVWDPVISTDAVDIEIGLVSIQPEQSIRSE